MKKIVFEQLGNSIVACILIVAICQTIMTSEIYGPGVDFFIELNFGFTWLIFLLAVIIFSVARGWYEKKFGNRDGYNKKDAELSSQDEREQLISSKATSLTYRSVVYYIGIALIVFLYGSSLFVSVKAVRLLATVILGSCLPFGFLTYLGLWIYFDHKL